MNTESARDFPIVGVGASAGGLEAYRQLLSALPPDTGAAFVLIQHLDPRHESMMAELLSRYTDMPVTQADQHLSVEPNHVYIIPPNRFMRLVERGLFLEDPVEEKGVRLAIDHFFRSMAEVRGERSIGIVLSGTGSDGSLGLREIKAAGGLAIVQDPATAEYDGMPRAAVNAGCTDFVLPINEISETLTSFIRHPYLQSRIRETSDVDRGSDQFKAILSLLRTHTDYDFHSYKTGTLERRIQRRMGLQRLSRIEDYVDLLRTSPDEVIALFRDLLIGVTRFFRDEDAWATLDTTVLEQTIRKKREGDALRVWIPGCATGEEAYTLAMILFNQLDAQHKRIELQIFATDLNEEAIGFARAGLYPPAIAADVPARYLQKYFQPDGDGYRVSKRLRETVVFALQNVISDAPFSRLDLISCRNLMIYLEPGIQRRMIEMFHFALAPDGVLFLGPSESGERPERLFAPLSKSHRIYRKADTPRSLQGSFPIVPSRDRHPATGYKREPATYRMSIDEIAKRVLLDRFVPATVLINTQLEVQYFYGPVRDYLDFPAGEPSSSLAEIAQEGLRRRVRALAGQTIESRTRSEAVVRGIRRNGHEVDVRITSEPVSLPGEDQGLFFVTFEDISRAPERDETASSGSTANDGEPVADSIVQQLEYELQAMKEDLHSTIEEMETSNEELKASNEEVMSMNEELQSTNEELETSREELQSLNEELSTVNSQLEDKIGELEATNNDLINLLQSTNIPTLFLDTDLCIRRFTPATRELMRIIESDIGRPVGDLAQRVNDPDLYRDSQTVLEKLRPIEAEVRNAAGEYFIRRIQPYRTSENRIEGVVVTYTDVTSLREATERIRKRDLQQQSISRLSEMALMEVDLEDLLDIAVSDLAQYLGVALSKVLRLEKDRNLLRLVAGVGWAEGLVGHASVNTGVGSQAGYTLQRAGPVIVDDFATEKRFGAPRLLRDHGVTCGISVVIGPSADPWGVLGAHDPQIGACEFDVDDVSYMQAIANTLWLSISGRRAKDDIERERAELRNFMDAMPFELSVVSPDERFLMVNAAYSEHGRMEEQIAGSALRDVLGEEMYRSAEPSIRAALRGEKQRFELRGPTGDETTPTWLVTYAPRKSADGSNDGFYSAAIDITPQKEAERRLAERTAQYETIGESIPFGVWICSADGELRYVSQSFLDMVGMTHEEAVAQGWADRLVPGTAEPTLAAWQECVASGGIWEREHDFISKSGERKTVLALGRPVRNEEGQIVSWSGLNLDITQRKRDEERSEVISAELDHRVKNILATIISIARLSATSSESSEEYRVNFEARIEALARAHQTLARSKWEGMPIRALIESELAPYIDARKVEIGGPDILLTRSTAQSVALVVHELATNAAKYGALGTEAGELSVSWSVESAEEPFVRFRWTENGLSNLTEPERAGFGTTVITEVISAQCDAGVELDYAPSGVKYTLDLPRYCCAGELSEV